MSRGAASSRAASVGSVSIAVLLVVVGLWAYREAFELIRVDVHSNWARQRVMDWYERGASYTEAEWQRADGDLRAAIAIAPDNAQLRVHLANLYMLRGLAEWDDDASRESHYAKALSNLTVSVRLRPMVGPVWADLANVYLGLNRVDDRYREAWSKALDYAPHDPAVLRSLLRLALATWSDGSSPRMQAWVREVYAGTTNEGRLAIDEIARPFGIEFAVEEQQANDAGDVSEEPPAAPRARATGTAR